MSTRGSIHDSFFQIRLIIVLALAGAVAGFIMGNRIAWGQLQPAQLQIVHEFEIGQALSQFKSCSIPHAPHWIIQRCAAYSELNANPAARQYLIPRARRALIIDPAAGAVGVAILAMAALALKSARFKRLDEHAPRDHFKTRRWVEFLDWLILAFIPVAGATGWLFHNRNLLLVLAAPLIAIAVLRPWAKRRKLKHVRGAKIDAAEDVEQLIRKQYKHRLGGLEIGGVPIPHDFEVLNFLIAGAPGTGKSTAIAPMIATMRTRGDRVFCADPRGDYLRRFYRDGDLILNPLDQRAVEWSPLSEIHDAADAAMIARSLIPDAEGQDAAWHRYAQLLLEGVLFHAKQHDLRNVDVARLMLSAGLDELRERLAGLPAAGLLPEKSDSPMFHSVRGTASPYVRALAWLSPAVGADGFSLRAWARDETVRSACWWNYQDAQIVGLRAIIATQFDLLALGVLEQSDSRERRTCLVVDELPALGRIASLEEFLSRARKAGGCAVLGVQSLVQLRRLYGEHSASAIIACCSNLLALALGDAESQEYVSKLLGEQEQSVETRSSSRSDASAQQTLQRTLRTERVVMASELSPGQLNSRHGFLRLPEVPIAPVKLEIAAFEDVAPRFQPHDSSPASAAGPAEASAVAPAATIRDQVSVIPEVPPLAADASPADLLDHLEARRQASWEAVRAQDAGQSGVAAD